MTQREVREKELGLINKLYNWWYRIRFLKKDGCFNCGVQEGQIVKYNWKIPEFRYLSSKQWILPPETKLYVMGLKLNKKGEVVSVNKLKLSKRREE